MLSKIVIDGYKCFDKADLEFKNFTLLSGVNSAGKSSVIQAILYMVQYLKLPGQQDMGYKYFDLGAFTDIRNSIKGNKEILLELDTQTADGMGSYEARITSDEETFKNTALIPSDPGCPGYTGSHCVTYLSVERIGVQRAYELNTKNPRDIGSRGEYSYSYLAVYGQDSIPEKRFAYEPGQIGLSLNNQVNYWLEYMLGFHVQTTVVADVDQVVATYSNARNNKYYRAKNVGTGVTYISMLIIAALSCRVGDTLIIENPEIHLHPRAQSRFIEFLAFLSNSGLQVIVETHSDHIYNGIRKCIKKKVLDKEKAAIYFLELDHTMQTKVNYIPLNSQGTEENHPYGLFDQFDDDLDELLDM